MNPIRIPKCDVRASHLLPGQVIWATDVFNLLPEGIYRVDEVTGEDIALSVGENVRLRIPLSALVILDTQVEEPTNWDECEARFLQHGPCATDCPDCQKRLKEIEAKQTRPQ